MTLEEKLAAMQTNALGNSSASPAPAVSQQNDFWGNLGAGGYSALNEGLMGLPDFIAKNVAGSQNYQALKNFQAQHQLASDIGEGVGLVGSMLIPGGAIAKGAGVLAKGAGLVNAGEKLAKAGEFLGRSAQAGEGLGQLALRGAGQAAEQALPRALTNLDFTSPDAFKQSAQQSLSEIPASLAMGAGAGALLGRVSQKFGGKSTLGGNVPEGVGATLPQFAVDEARKAVNNATLASAGLQGRAIKSAARSLGIKGATAGAKGDDYVDALAQGIRDYGIKGKRQWDALVDQTRDTWDEVQKGFQENAPKGWNVQLADSLTRDPGLMQHLAEAGNEEAATKQFLDTAVHLSQTPDLATVRNKLSNVIKAGLHSPDGDANAKAQMAMAIKNKIDDYVEQTSGVDMGNAKGMYKLIQPFLWQEGKDIFKLENPLGEAGSQTFEKLGGAGIGAALGGGNAVSGDLAEGKDIDVGKTLAGMTVGGVLGPLAMKAIRGGGNALINKGVRAAGGALESPEVVQGIQNAAEATPMAATRGAALMVDKNTLVQPVQEQPLQDPLAEKAKVKVAENALPDSKVDDAKTEMTDRFKSVMATRLRYIHDNFYPDTDPKDFMAAVQKKTGNFKDMTANADLLFTDPTHRADFLREYQNHLLAKSLDVDKALNPLASVNIAGLKGEGYNEREQLKELLIARMTGGDLKARTPAVEKQADEYIKNVQRNPEMLTELHRQLQSPLLTNLGVS